jgi:hypothetical protein
MDFSHPSETLIAALVGALATVVTALIQLRISWRKELRERERGQPITKKSRRGPVLVVFALMIAAAVGGFALSQYFVSLQTTSRDELRADLNAMRAELSATAARVEQSRTNERKEIETEVQRADAQRLGEEGAAASVLVGPCSPMVIPGARQECTEQSAMRVTVCASVPASATVKEVQLYIRADDKQPWADARVQPGQEAGQARFADKFSERAEDGAKQVCQAFASWSHEKARIARIVVKYSL